ncbi:MAG: type II toxin-antitoxin system prevent-host-death family antitoxin [Lachnospiraceae bacterium]|nr:type II toxin-antitoxin system prevent-host-death family antitoxin [Lachnospiraceae bacterium]
MATIYPVSDLRNYREILDRVEEGSPVYLTVNGRGRYTIRDIAEDEAFEKTKAMLRLFCELNEGRISGEKEGYVSAEEVRARLREL